MIELVFVIVVLGIIASIAIPKINASREDAKVVAAFNELNNFIENIIAKNTLGHQLSSTIHAEMNALGARVDWASGDDAYYDFRLGIDEGLSKTCITITIQGQNRRIVGTTFLPLLTVATIIVCAKA